MVLLPYQQGVLIVEGENRYPIARLCFFELYAYRFETGDLEEVVGTYKTPVKVSHGDPL